MPQAKKAVSRKRALPPRFSKVMMVALVAKQLADVVARHGLDAGQGEEQVQGRGEQANKAYGEMSALRWILAQIEGTC